MRERWRFAPAEKLPDAASRTAQRCWGGKRSIGGSLGDKLFVRSDGDGDLAKKDLLRSGAEQPQLVWKEIKHPVALVEPVSDTLVDPAHSLSSGGCTNASPFGPLLRSLGQPAI